MDLSINIAVGSAAQVALFVAPLLVVVSFFVGPQPLALVFNGLEVGALPHGDDHRQPHHEPGRIDLVRGAHVARRLQRPGGRILVRVDKAPRREEGRPGRGLGTLTWDHSASETGKLAPERERQREKP
jgi:hypothetical protein